MMALEYHRWKGIAPPLHFSRISQPATGTALDPDLAADWLQE